MPGMPVSAAGVRAPPLPSSACPPRHARSLSFLRPPAERRGAWGEGGCAGPLRRLLWPARPAAGSAGGPGVLHWSATSLGISRALAGSDH
eukprot:6183944-Pleurochrysis_carterae.AAC.1